MTMASLRTESALERAFRYFSPDHSPANLRAAARELIAERRRFRASIARRLAGKRADMRRHAREHGVPASAPFLADLSRHMREDMTRHAPRRATLDSMRRELSALHEAEDWRQSESYAAWRRALPPRARDGADINRAMDIALARVLVHGIRILERESR